jgi:putative acetyltransferase
MTLADFDEVRRLWENTEGVGLNESDTRPCIALYLERNPNMSFVARSGSKLIGAVLCGHDGRRGYLHHLAVDETHRRKGVGRRLVQSCLGALERCGILKCNIFVYANNKDGEVFWSREGWSTREDLRMMQKPIAPFTNGTTNLNADS